MARSTQAQRAERVRAAQELLARGTSMVEAAVALSRDFGLSRRQAYRDLEEAQAVASPPVVAEASVTITLKIPSNIVRELRAYSAISGLTISEIVRRAISAFCRQRADMAERRNKRDVCLEYTLTVCSSPSSNRSIGPSSPIAYGLSASLPRRKPGAAS